MSVHEPNLEQKGEKNGKKKTPKNRLKTLRPNDRTFIEKKSLKIADSISVLQEKSRFSIKT